jgi:mono/diheme cytochrome c family protein
MTSRAKRPWWRWLSAVAMWVPLASMIAQKPVGQKPAAPKPAGAPTPRTGAQVYVATCITCHQANGQGVRGAFPPLAKTEWVIGRAEVPIAIVLHGMTGEMAIGGIKYNVPMAPLATLSDQEIANVLTYVRSQWGNKAAAVTAADVAGVRTATKSRKTPWTPGELRKAFP